MPDPTPWWQQAGVIAAAVAFLGSLIAIAVNGWRAQRDRKRKVFAEAFAAVTAYWEYPYVVRRRRADQPAEERIRISEQLRATQERINFHEAWLATESQEVANAYCNLVRTTRSVIGPQIREAWKGPAASDDRDMNVDDVNHTGLDDVARRYLAAAAGALTPMPTWTPRRRRR